MSFWSSPSVGSLEKEKMDNINNNKQQPQQKKQKWFFSLVFSLLLSTILIIISVSMSSTSTKFYNRAYVQTPRPRFVEQQLQVVSTSSEKIPRLAYLISGSTGDGESLKRTLKALYHPRNQYAVHLDLEAPVEERLELARFVESEPLFVNVGNVRMVSKANLVTYRGPTMVTNTLHAAAILFKEGGDWDWFINLSASDYPLVTQDGKSMDKWGCELICIWFYFEFWNLSFLVSLNTPFIVLAAYQLFIAHLIVANFV